MGRGRRWGEQFLAGVSSEVVPGLEFRRVGARGPGLTIPHRITALLDGPSACPKRPFRSMIPRR